MLRRPLAIVTLALLALLVSRESIAAPVRVKIEFGWGGAGDKLTWDGQVKVEGGRLVEAENYLMDGDEGFRDKTESGLSFKAFTEGATDGLIITVDGPPATKISFISPVKSFDVTLAQLFERVLNVKADDKGARVQVNVDVSSQFNAPPQECRSVVADARGRVWTVGVENDGPATSRKTRQKIVLGRWREDAWEPIADVAKPGIVFFPAAAADGEGGLWIAWCEFSSRNWDVYVRRFDGEKLGKRVRLTRSPAVDLEPALCADSTGNVYVAWQTNEAGSFDVVARRFDGGKWSPEMKVADSPDHEFRPALAADSDGRLWVAWDKFRDSDYDIFARSFDGEKWSDEAAVFASGKDEDTPSIAADRNGNVWIVAAQQARGLRGGERVALLKSAQQAVSGAPLTDVTVDGHGRLWFFGYHEASRTRPALLRAAAYVGSRFSPPLGAVIGRGWSAPYVDAQGRIWHATSKALAVIPTSLPAELQAEQPIAAQPVPPPEETKETIAPPLAGPRHEIVLDGTKLSLYWGELHTHLTEFVTDQRIRSREDRYYLTADHRIGLDIGATSDHDWPIMTLSKYHVQQAIAAALNRPGEFVACSGFEWSGDSATRKRYGDRTVVFFDDYADIPRITDPSANTPAKLHRALKKSGSIDWPHHVGAQWAVMDWTTLDPVVEPVVEMTSVHGVYETYDKARMVAPFLRPPVTEKTSLQYGLSQGHKFAFVGSSDSHSGISGYQTGMLGVYAETLTRKGIFDAWRSRRAYALRGGKPIVVEFSVNGTFMGGETTADGPPRLAATIVGTSDIERVEVVRDNQYVYTKQGDGGPRLQLQYADEDAAAGEHYYYLRVFQGDDAYAWASPVWVTVE